MSLSLSYLERLIAFRTISRDSNFDLVAFVQGELAGLGIPAVVCGPGSIAVAHKPDEYVEVSQVAACDAFLARLVDRLAA